MNLYNAFDAYQYVFALANTCITRMSNQIQSVYFQLISREPQTDLDWK